MSDHTIVLAAGAAATALYYKKWSPESRVQAMSNTLDKAKELNNATLEIKSELSPEHQRLLADAEEQKGTLFMAMVNVNNFSKQLQSEGPLRRYVIPTYSYEDGGETIVLEDLESEVSGYKDDALTTSVRAKEYKKMEETVRADQQPPQIPISQPARSFDMDLEVGYGPLLG